MKKNALVILVGLMIISLANVNCEADSGDKENNMMDYGNYEGYMLEPPPVTEFPEGTRIVPVTMETINLNLNTPIQELHLPENIYFIQRDTAYWINSAAIDGYKDEPQDIAPKVNPPDLAPDACTISRPECE